ncbi:hypothetical protein C0Q70_00906 [Pomacea canaliculata]|uniref:Transmembrane protein 26 n=1 Tax=Pomacea canaliculata TaxID=400727 RepID=A0A2T7PXZ2_POMCA|nr:hypothetical protein C0Q70_00906 [Pomacea canaliculata]
MMKDQRLLTSTRLALLEQETEVTDDVSKGAGDGCAAEGAAGATGSLSALLAGRMAGHRGLGQDAVVPDMRNRALPDRDHLHHCQTQRDRMEVLDIPLRLSSDTWVLVMEELLLYLMILGRWILPRGHVGREELSQLLFAFLGMASDMIDLFSLFEEDRIRVDMSVTYALLAVWSWSVLQFSLTFYTAHRPRRARGLQMTGHRHDTLSVYRLNIIYTELAASFVSLFMQIVILCHKRVRQKSEEDGSEVVDEGAKDTEQSLRGIKNGHSAKRELVEYNNHVDLEESDNQVTSVDDGGQTVDELVAESSNTDVTGPLCLDASGDAPLSPEKDRMDRQEQEKEELERQENKDGNLTVNIDTTTNIDNHIN